MLEIQSHAGRWEGHGQGPTGPVSRPHGPTAGWQCLGRISQRAVSPVVSQPRGGGEGTAQGHATGGRESSCDLDSHARSHADTHMLTPTFTCSLALTRSHSCAHTLTRTLTLRNDGGPASQQHGCTLGVKPGRCPDAWAQGRCWVPRPHRCHLPIPCPLSLACQAPHKHRPGRQARCAGGARSPAAAPQQLPHTVLCAADRDSDAGTCRRGAAGHGRAPPPDAAESSAPSTFCRRSLMWRCDERTALQVPSP